MTCFAKVTITTSTVCLVYHRPHFRGTLLIHTRHLLQNHSFSSSANTEHEAYLMHALWLRLQWVINSWNDPAIPNLLWGHVNDHSSVLASCILLLDGICIWVKQQSSTWPLHIRHPQPCQTYTAMHSDYLCSSVSTHTFIAWNMER